MFRSVSTTMSGEMMGRIASSRHRLRTTPAAPAGEFNPAKIALVSRKTLNFFGIALFPKFRTSLFYCFQDIPHRVSSSDFLFGQAKKCLYFEVCNFPL